MEGKNILDDVFNTTEEDVETFVEAIGPLIGESDDYSRRVASGKPEQVQAPQLVEQTSGFIRIQHGWDGSNYVWHISAWHHQRPFKASIERVMYAIAKIMNAVIPQSVEVKIWPPYQDWDIQEITFKAMDLDDHWSITKKSLDEMNLKLFEVLNTLV